MASGRHGARRVARRLATAGLAGLILLTGACGGGGADDPLGRPWEVTQLPGGGIEVLGLRPGESRMAEALALLGPRVEAALFTAPGDGAVVEAYYSSVNAGGITGRLVLTLDLPEAVLEGLRARSPDVKRTRTGAIRYTLSMDDSELLLGAPIRAVTFVPSVDLKEEVVRARFGTPAERVETAAGEVHLLYPELGLDVLIARGGRTLLQYGHPEDFDWLRREASRHQEAAAGR